MTRIALALLTFFLLAVPSSALARDRDRDGLPDRWERKHDLSTKKKSANRDPDRDNVDNGNEFREGTRPRDKDSDGDGRRDGREDRDHDKLRNAAEDATGNDPRDPDTDDDGVEDGRERAGVVVSFEDGLLKLDLANGGSLEGDVTADTRIKCRSESEAEGEHRGKGGAHKALFEDGDEPPFDPGDEGLGEPGEDEPGSDEDWEFKDDFPDDSGDDSKHDEKGEDHAECSKADLRPGVGVNQARLEVTPDGVFFEKLELIR